MLSGCCLHPVSFPSIPQSGFKRGHSVVSTHKGNEIAAQLESLLSADSVMKSLTIWGTLPWAAPSMKTPGLETRVPLINGSLALKHRKLLGAQMNRFLKQALPPPLAVLQSTFMVQFIWIPAVPIGSPILIAHSCVASTNRMREELTPWTHTHGP